MTIYNKLEQIGFDKSSEQGSYIFHVKDAIIHISISECKEGFLISSYRRNKKGISDIIFSDKIVQYNFQLIYILRSYIEELTDKIKLSEEDKIELDILVTKSFGNLYFLLGLKNEIHNIDMKILLQNEIESHSDNLRTRGCRSNLL